MCGRYYIEEEDSAAELAAIMKQLQRSGTPNLKTSGEIYPTNVVPIVRRDGNGTAPTPAIWGMNPFGKLIINARSETIADKPLFRNAEPCLVPATNYFEWENAQIGMFDEKVDEKTVHNKNNNAELKDKRSDIRDKRSIIKDKRSIIKEKRSIKPKGRDGFFYMAGLLTRFRSDELPTFAIVTQSAAKEIEYIHDRMPYILCGKNEIDCWLSDKWVYDNRDMGFVVG